MNATGSARAWWPHANGAPGKYATKDGAVDKTRRCRAALHCAAAQSRPVGIEARPEDDLTGVAGVRRARPAARDAGRALDAAGDARQEACGSATAFIPSRYVSTVSLTLGTGKPAGNGQEARALLFACVARARIVA